MDRETRTTSKRFIFTVYVIFKNKSERVPYLMFSSPIVYLLSYNDARNDFVMNEVALDYNSGFQMAVAGLLNDAAGKDFEMICS